MRRKFFNSLRKYSFTILTPILSISLVACDPYEIEETDIPCSQEGHIHAVDLGLSVKWACCNIGANSPEEYGGYYAWGETQEKNYYDSSTYAWLDIETNDMTKYNDIDKKTPLTLKMMLPTFYGVKIGACLPNQNFKSSWIIALGNGLLSMAFVAIELAVMEIASSSQLRDPVTKILSLIRVHAVATCLPHYMSTTSFSNVV